MHMEGVTVDQIERMKKLNMFIAVHPREIVTGGLLHRVWGDRAFAMPPLKEIQDSGIMWGLGTDAFEVNQFRPFQTLYWAVTGKMVGGTVVNTHTVSREAALIAHTRSNAYLFFRENDLGSIQTGTVRRSGRDRSRLSDGAGRSDQGHQAGADDGRRARRCTTPRPNQPRQRAKNFITVES